jgi:EAL domain-containing protein (putative c-di-GMP-specific phosphodiesterase class I)
MSSQISKSRIEVLLRDAIENDGFKIVYQPQIDLRTEKFTVMRRCSV